MVAAESAPQDHEAWAEALGHTIKVVRTDLGFGRRRLAGLAGISYSYLSAIENGTKPPSGKMQHVLSGALGVRMHELIAAAEARLSPNGPDIELSHSIEIDQALTRRDQRSAARYLRSELMPLESRQMSPSPSRTDLGALTELRGLLASMSGEDVEFLLEMARKLARRS